MADVTPQKRLSLKIKAWVGFMLNSPCAVQYQTNVDGKTAGNPPAEQATRVGRAMCTAPFGRVKHTVRTGRANPSMRFSPVDRGQPVHLYLSIIVYVNKMSTSLSVVVCCCNSHCDLRCHAKV